MALIAVSAINFVCPRCQAQCIMARDAVNTKTKEVGSMVVHIEPHCTWFAALSSRDFLLLMEKVEEALRVKEAN